MFSLTGKTAVITGAGSGIGRAISIMFAKRGARVEVFDLDPPKAEETAALILADGGVAQATACDVADQAAVNAAVQAVITRAGRIDILVNNAGIAGVGNVQQTTEELMDRVYRVNVKGVYNCLHAAVPTMAAAGGGVVLNMCSIAAMIGIKDRFAYSASKGAVMAMTLSVAMDYVDKKVRCNCICPARIHTPFVDGFLKASYPGREAEVFKSLSDYQPVGRMGTPEEVAALALYLCSDEAAFVTGSAYTIDGGVTSLI